MGTFCLDIFHSGPPPLLGPSGWGMVYAICVKIFIIVGCTHSHPSLSQPISSDPRDVFLCHILLVSNDWPIAGLACVIGIVADPVGPPIAGFLGGLGGIIFPMAVGIKVGFFSSVILSSLLVFCRAVTFVFCISSCSGRVCFA